jgi:hypothetical protein
MKVQSFLFYGKAFQRSVLPPSSERWLIAGKLKPVYTALQPTGRPSSWTMLNMHHVFGYFHLLSHRNWIRSTCVYELRTHWNRLTSKTHSQLICTHRIQKTEHTCLTVVPHAYSLHIRFTADPLQVHLPPKIGDSLLRPTCLHVNQFLNLYFTEWDKRIPTFLAY